MEDGDDDFGDLYADVEVDAMNVAPQISQISTELDKQDGDNDIACVRVDSEDDDDDDDDDDLDIVLNSDDDNREGFAIARNNTNSRSTELDDEDDDNLGAEVKIVGNSRSMYKYLRAQPAAYGSDSNGIRCMTSYWPQMGPQSAQRFSLPRARNTLDVNIDIFEQKPWKHPGADVTDYFNFGFNEDSWRHYCNQVDEYRHREPVSSWTPPSEPDESANVNMRKGQAIEVENSIFERQSSMDIRRQVDRDSDVIQITILDPEDISVPKESNHGLVSGDDVTDHLSFSSASDDESVEGNQVDNHEIYQVRTNVTIRTSEDTKESNLVAESSQEEKSPANHLKSIEDDAYIYSRKAYTHDRSLTELTRSVKPDYHNSDDLNISDDKRGFDENKYNARSFGDSRKYRDHIYHERCNNHVYKNRTHKDFIMKTHYENDYIISRRNDVKRKSGEHKYHTRHNVHSSYLQRLHDFDSYHEENRSYSKSEVSSDYYDKKFGGYKDWDTETFGANMDRTVFRSLEEGDYYDDERRYIDDNRMMSVDWCHYETGQKKGENPYFRSKGEIDEFYIEPRYYDDTDAEKFRSLSFNDRKIEDAEYTRWLFKSPGRNKRNLFSELENSFLKKNNERFFSSDSPEESYINNHKFDGFYQRHESYGGQHFEPFDKEDYIIDIDGDVDMRRKRYNWESEIQLEDEIVFRHVEELIDDPFVVGSHMVDRIGYVKELTDGQCANAYRYYKPTKEIFSGNKCVKSHGKSRKQLPLSFRKSHLAVGQVKSSEKHKKPERAVLDTGKNDKIARADKTKPIDEDLDIKEGQIVTKVGPINQNTKSGFDSTQILEARAKMEKQRARFNEPITVTKKGSVKVTVVDSNKQERPARKRRWGGN